jgi:hypothetical protein
MLFDEGGFMSKELAVINGTSYARFYGSSEKGVCLQITDSSGTYIQLTVGEIIAAISVFKDVIDFDLKSKIKQTKKDIAALKIKEKTLFHEQINVNEMAISQHVLSAASLINFYDVDVVKGDEDE